MVQQQNCLTQETISILADSNMKEQEKHEQIDHQSNVAHINIG